MAELVAKTSDAVAVDDSLTTLLDWTNIESLAGFTIIVENAGAEGIIYSIYSNWFGGPDCIEIIYRGGYCAAGQTPGDGETAMPADLREAAIEQASFIFKRKDDIGLAGVGFEGGSISKFSAMKLLPLVEDVLKKYRRPQI